MQTTSFDADTEQLIDQYIQGKLKGADLQAFETRLEADTRLQEEVALRHDIKVGIRVAERKAIRKILDEADRNRAATPTTPTRGKQPNSADATPQGAKVWVWAAVAAVAVGAALLLYVLLS